MLDSKLNLFFLDCKKKSESLAKEINVLKLENVELEKEVGFCEEENFKLLSMRNKFQLQFEQISQINKKIGNDTENMDLKATKAKNDYCNITKAHQLQRANILKNEKELKERENFLMTEKKNRVKDSKYTMQLLNEKIINLRREIQRKEEINTAARLSLLEKELKESHQVTNIKGEQLSHLIKS